MTANDSRFVSFAENRADAVLFRALQAVARGFYIDVGARDPVVGSVTKAFYDRGWQGINLEPSRICYERLAEARPRDINLNLAAWNAREELEFHDVEASGRVAADTLANLCRMHAVDEVHFLKIDVEGSEFQVLEGMDFHALRPWIVLVEAIDPLDHSPTHERWEVLLLAAAYEFVLFDGVNRFYCDRARPALRAALLAPANVLDNDVAVRYRTPGKAFPSGFGINLFGQFSSATGLGVTARQIAKALRAAGVPFTAFDSEPYYPSGDVTEELRDIARFIVSDPTALCFPINLYCAPVFDFPQIFQKIPPELTRGRLHAAIVWWETTKLYAQSIDGLVRLDAVVACSDFLVGVLANSLPLTPVIRGSHPLLLPDDIRADRAALGLAAAPTVFVSSFDPSSDPARKNPLAVIAAFRQAFPAADTDVRLVFRLNNAQATELARETTPELIDAAAGDQRIGFVLGAMDYRQVLTLYASADVYVSLHRAEGLGLGMLEAMRLGVPVIATAWSGNMSFMDHRSACLVRYRLTQVSGNHLYYRSDRIDPDAVWADPVIEDAVAWMRHLHLHPDEGRRRGAMGRARVERYQEEAQALGWLHELAEIWRMAAHFPCVDGRLGMAGPP